MVSGKMSFCSISGPEIMMIDDDDMMMCDYWIHAFEETFLS